MRWRVPWPAPALLTWLAAWLLYAAVRASVATFAAPWSAALLALCAGTVLGVLAMRWGATPWRRACIALGFPLSLAASGAAVLPAWAWLVPAALCLALYPPRAWRDAPVFPTPAGALDDLARAAPLPPGARVLDAGCGFGDGLIALRRAYPHAVLEGVEYSVPVWAMCWLRCRLRGVRARVRRGDMWQAGAWHGCALVYGFQRPESMGRIAAKAQAELAPGAWLVSLEFPVPESERRGFRSAATLAGPRTVHVLARWDSPSGGSALGAGSCT
jgi:hypothetical protein